MFTDPTGHVPVCVDDCNFNDDVSGGSSSDIINSDLVERDPLAGDIPVNAAETPLVDEVDAELKLALLFPDVDGAVGRFIMSGTAGGEGIHGRQIRVSQPQQSETYSGLALIARDTGSSAVNRQITRSVILQEFPRYRTSQVEQRTRMCWYFNER